MTTRIEQIRERAEKATPNWVDDIRANWACMTHYKTDILWLLKRLGEAEALVTRIEWGDHEETCPDCMNGKEFGHAADCRLAAFLATLAEGEVKDG